MLIVGDILVAAANLAGVGIGLEREGLSGLDEGCGVGVHVEFVEEDGAGEKEGSFEVKIAGKILGDDSLVDVGEDGERRSVLDHLFEFAIVGDVHQL